MFDKLLSMFQTNSVHRLALVTSIGANILKTFEQEFANDHNAKDAAIDSIVALLLAHKGPTQAVPIQEAAKAA